ncbi:MAG: peptidoglycan DD-metalloendopeptidase family protein, partial [Parafilimonas sp.]
MSSSAISLYNLLKAHAKDFHKIVDFDEAKENILYFDFSDKNTELEQLDVTNTKKFSAYISDKLKASNAKFGIGGYNENRSLYKKSKLFHLESPKDPPVGEDADETTSRTLHLGIDIWGEAGTKIYALFGGMVHSFSFNNNFGDYGATIILSHQLEGVSFYTLYGHLSLKDIASIKEGYYITRGQEFAHFGNENENGEWPPHLHFQVIKDMGLYKGDYPGVCKYSERKQYLENSPDPCLILN